MYFSDMICETMHELDEWYFIMKISYLKCYDEAWLNILISWCIILIDFDTTWLYILLSKLEYEIWFMKNYDIRNIMNWQSDYVKDPANGGIYVGNWFILKIYVVRKTSDMSPVRPATNYQRDQWFRRTLLSNDLQFTTRRYAVLWPSHRKNMVIAHSWRKEFKNERN